MGRNERAEVARGLFSYICANHFEGDSEDELARWWRGLVSVHPDTDLVTEVLEELLAAGTIEKHLFEDDLFCYRAMRKVSGDEG